MTVLETGCRTKRCAACCVAGTVLHSICQCRCTAACAAAHTLPDFHSCPTLPGAVPSWQLPVGAAPGHWPAEGTEAAGAGRQQAHSPASLNRGAHSAGGERSTTSHLHMCDHVLMFFTCGSVACWRGGLLIAKQWVGVLSSLGMR